MLDASRQLTLSTLTLSAVIIALVLGVALWSWWRRQQRTRQRRASEAERQLAALMQARDDLQRLAAHREALVEQERQRLAREFHDELGQLLTAARMRLQLLARDPDAAHFEAVETLLGDAYRSIKAIAADLRPPALNLGLTAAVEWLVERLLVPQKITPEITIAAAADRLTEAQSIIVFRVIQETLANCVRHARAQHVGITLDMTDTMARLEIRDDGCGFLPAAVDSTTHFGLLGLRERSTALGGTLTIASQPGEGASLILEFTPCFAS